MPGTLKGLSPEELDGSWHDHQRPALAGTLPQDRSEPRLSNALLRQTRVAAFRTQLLEPSIERAAARD